ncbi:PEGA domain-containing protein [Flavobacterium sp. RHBU_24]|uniref:PEGA domain-containing protein n=1 Tax=Flavobacterium sp. RHBU_24 TaxID=3391185 RepID=UPI00398529BE
MKKCLTALAAFALVLSATGCATIVSGSKQYVNFTSTPAKASILIDGNFEGRTPMDIKLVRKKSHTVVIRLEGYKDFETKLERKFNAWYIGNIVFGGLVGIIVDPITGAMYKLTPGKINAQLSQATTSINGEILINVALVPEGTQLEKIGQLEKL